MACYGIHWRVQWPGEQWHWINGPSATKMTCSSSLWGSRRYLQGQSEITSTVLKTYYMCYLDVHWQWYYNNLHQQELRTKSPTSPQHCPLHSHVHKQVTLAFLCGHSCFIFSFLVAQKLVNIFSQSKGARSSKRKLFRASLCNLGPTNDT